MASGGAQRSPGGSGSRLAPGPDDEAAAEAEVARLLQHAGTAVALESMMSDARIALGDAEAVAERELASIVEHMHDEFPDDLDLLHCAIDPPFPEDLCRACGWLHISGAVHNATITIR